MRVHITENKELAATIRQELKENEGFCPCVYQSKGKPEYKCFCKDFRENVQVGNACYCGLYVKDEM